MSLQKVFSLTPRESRMRNTAGHSAVMNVFGTVIRGKFTPTYRLSFDQLHASDELHFHHFMFGDEAADYADWLTVLNAPHVNLHIDLSDFGPHKEVVLIFRFDALTESRVLLYTDAGLLGEEIMQVGDDQFLIEVESTDELWLRFMHVNRAGENIGGRWYFRGIDGYIV